MIEYTKTTKTTIYLINCTVSNTASIFTTNVASTNIGPVVSISDCTISSCNAEGQLPLIGLETGMEMNLSISNTTFINNAATAIVRLDAIPDTSSTTPMPLSLNVTNCTFNNNTATTLIYSSAVANSTLTATIQNNHFVSNDIDYGIQHDSSGTAPNNIQFDTSNNDWSLNSPYEILYHFVGFINSVIVDSTTISDKVGGMVLDMLPPESANASLTFTNVTAVGPSNVMGVQFLDSVNVSNLQVNDANTAGILSILECRNVNLEDLLFVNSNGIIVNYTGTSSQFTLNRAQFTGVINAVQLNQNVNATLSNTVFENCTAALSATTSLDVILSNVTVWRTKNNASISLANTSNIRVSNCHFYDATQNAHPGADPTLLIRRIGQLTIESTVFALTDFPSFSVDGDSQGASLNHVESNSLSTFENCGNVTISNSDLQDVSVIYTNELHVQNTTLANVDHAVFSTTGIVSFQNVVFQPISVIGQMNCIVQLTGNDNTALQDIQLKLPDLVTPPINISNDETSLAGQLQVELPSLTAINQTVEYSALLFVFDNLTSNFSNIVVDPPTVSAYCNATTTPQWTSTTLSIIVSITCTQFLPDLINQTGVIELQGNYTVLPNTTLQLNSEIRIVVNGCVDLAGTLQLSVLPTTTPSSQSTLLTSNCLSGEFQKIDLDTDHNPSVCSVEPTYNVTSMSVMFVACPQGFPAGAIAGIVVGSVVLLAGIAIGLGYYFLVVKPKKVARSQLAKQLELQ